MAQGALGDLVTFAISGVTTYGIVVGVPDTTHNNVAYTFDLPHPDKLTWSKEYLTTSVTVRG